MILHCHYIVFFLIYVRSKDMLVARNYMLFKPLSHQGGVLTAFSKRSKKLQIAQVRAVQSPAPLWKLFEDAEQSPRTPCGGVCFEQAQN